MRRLSVNLESEEELSEAQRRCNGRIVRVRVGISSDPTLTLTVGRILYAMALALDQLSISTTSLYT